MAYEENMTGTTTYIYGPTGRIVKRTDTGETHTFYYHDDHLGSARVVTDSNKNIVSAVTYHPFGKISTQEGTEQYLYNGKEKDATDLYYYGARYYDSELGRFISRDPFSGNMLQPQSLNQYSYCANTPPKIHRSSWLVNNVCRRGRFGFRDQVESEARARWSSIKNWVKMRL